MKSLTIVIKLILLIIFQLLVVSCGSSNNILGGNQNSQNYNPNDGNPPQNAFNISIQKGTSSGPCGIVQDLITNSNSMCFELSFERAPANFNPNLIQITQPGTNAVISSTTNPDSLHYAVVVDSYLNNGSEDGLYNLNIPANTFFDQYGNGNLASNSPSAQIELSQFVRNSPSLPTFAGGTYAPDSCQGLELQTWISPVILNLNTFFAGSPGAPPGFIIDDFLVGNLLNSDHFQFRPAILNYVMRWSGYIEITNPGNYRFRTSSDDGSRVYINGIRVVNNDGVHSLKTITSSNVNLGPGLHLIELQFFFVAGGSTLNFTYMGPDTANTYVSPASEIFRPLNCPKPSADNNLFNSYWSGSSPYINDLNGVIRDDTIQKHIKTSLDKQSLIKITVGSFINGSSPINSDNSHVVIAHNNAPSNIAGFIGLTNLGGPAWNVMPRIWRMECIAGSDNITMAIDSGLLDPLADSIIFSDNDSFSSGVKALELNTVGSNKALTFQCSDFNSSVVYFTFGKYNL